MSKDFVRCHYCNAFIDTHHETYTVMSDGAHAHRDCDDIGPIPVLTGEEKENFERYIKHREREAVKIAFDKLQSLMSR